MQRKALKKVFRKPPTFLSRSFNSLTGNNIENVFGMSLGSEPHHGNVAVSASERQVATTTPERSGGEVSGYKEVRKQHEAVKKRLCTISEKRPK